MRRRTSALAWAALAVAAAGYLGLEGIAGARRSPMVPRLPRGAGVAGWSRSLAGALGFKAASAPSLTLAAVLLVAIVGCAVLVLAREASRGRASLGPILVVTAASMALVAAGPVLLSRDVTSYAAYGRMLGLHAANPYVVTPARFAGDPFAQAVSPEWLRTTSVYGPVFTLTSAEIARAGSRSVEGTLRAFQVLAAAAAFGAVVLAASLGRLASGGSGGGAGGPGRGAGRPATAAALAGLNPVVILHTVGGGHNDALVALLLALGAWFAVRSARPALTRRAPAVLGLAATVSFTVAALVKVVAVAALLVWLWALARDRGRGRGAARTVAGHAAVAVAVAAAAFAPLMAGVDTMSPITGAATRQGWASPAAFVARTARSVFAWVGGDGVGARAATASKVLFVLVFLALAWRILRAATPAGLGVATGLLMLAIALTAPYLLPWYSMWFVPFLALLEDPPVRGIALSVSLALALTAIPAEPSAAPSTWHAMITGVHDALAPMLLVLLAVFAVRLWRQPAGAMATSRSAKARA